MEEKQNLAARIRSRVRYEWAEWINSLQLARLTSQVAKAAPQPQSRRPVVFFNASTRLRGVSLNAAYSNITAWALRLSGIPVVHFVCRRGMTRCVLGTDMDDHTTEPPCESCIVQSEKLYAQADVRWFTPTEYPDLLNRLNGTPLNRLEKFVYEGIPLGELVLASLRWRLRRYHLEDETTTLFLYRQFILSAYNVDVKFNALLDETNPAVAVVFNGQMYPEAVARWAAIQRDIPVVTHEVSHQPMSAFFTYGEATAYPFNMPDDFQLDERQNAVLDAYLSDRFQGQFSMAGINFWPEIHGFDQVLQDKIERFKQMAVVFTNVIFDTSQGHANVVFEHMFHWMDEVLAIIKAHPETLFVIRAHPDEARPHSRKKARETVQQWAERNRIAELPNVHYIAATEYVSSYDLVRSAKFSFVYNSTIALEAVLMGRVVLCGGQARFTPYNTMYFPKSVAAFHKKAEELLAAEAVENPPEFLPFLLFLQLLHPDPVQALPGVPPGARLRGVQEVPGGGPSARQFNGDARAVRWYHQWGTFPLPGRRTIDHETVRQDR
jgi:hypothetical protein